MKFRTSREVLLRPLRVVTGVVDRRHTLPVLANLLLEASDDGLLLRATDLEMEVVARVREDVEVAQSGVVTVSAQKLGEIWQSLPDGAQVQVALESDRVVLRSGSSRFVLATIPVADFPSSQEGEEEEGLKVELALPHSDMRRLIERTKCAMANQDVRYFLNGPLAGVEWQHVAGGGIRRPSHGLVYSGWRSGSAGDLAAHRAPQKRLGTSSASWRIAKRKCGLC